VLEQPRLDLVRGDERLVVEEAARRERAPVLGAGAAETPEDAVARADDAAVGVAERPRVGL